jgi:hypothetical protein
VFESIGSNNPTVTSDDSSALSFSPNSPLNVSQIVTLKASYLYTTGNCHGGSLRWSIATTLGNLFIYYGAEPNTIDCNGFNSQSDQNMIALDDLRYDTSGISGGSFYDTYTHAMQLVGSLPVQYVALVLDSGWGGDQVVSLSSATLNDNTWTPSPSDTPTPTCALPPANIKITKTAGSTPGVVNEVAAIQPTDTGSQFRVLSCNYMYNLATSSLSGAGTYTVEVVINNNNTAAGNAMFGLK